MPEGRDRIERQVDYSAIFANRRSNGILLDEPDSQLNLFEPPVQRLPLNPEPVSIVRRSSVIGNFSSLRSGNRIGHSPFRFSQGKENMPPAASKCGKARASSTVLPSWYPRTPLRDITHIVLAMERKRAATGVEVEIPTHREIGVLESPVHKVTPVGFKRSCPQSTAKVQKMLLDITKEKSEEEEEEAGDIITPEKKLLNSIDIVEKIVMKEIQKLNSTPTAKREERERKVRTLMSMR